jgi:tetratricopeptide (TPR) repeat protein
MQIFQENRGYLAVVGFAVFSGVVLESLWRRRQAAGIAALVILLLIYSAAVIQRNQGWQDQVAFAEREVRMNPNSYWAHEGAAHLFLRRGEVDKAILEAKRAIHIYSGHAYPYFLLGTAYTRKEELDLAIRAFEDALRLAEPSSNAHVHVARLYHIQKKYGEAEKHLLRAAELLPGDDLPHYGLGQLYTDQGRWEEAVREYREALRFNPAHLKAKEGLDRALQALKVSKNEVLLMDIPKL